MHAAPSVRYPVGRSQAALAVLALAWLAGLAAVSLWTWHAPQTAWRLALAWTGVAAAGALAFGGWRRSPVGLLAWDGVAWSWESAERGANPEPGQAAIALDLQSRLLLRWESAGGTVRWLSLQRQAAAPHWDALRRAVHSRVATDAPQVAPPPVAAR